jgi:hypothetical protein
MLLLSALYSLRFAVNALLSTLYSQRFILCPLLFALSSQVSTKSFALHADVLARLYASVSTLYFLSMLCYQHYPVIALLSMLCSSWWRFMPILQTRTLNCAKVLLFAKGSKCRFHALPPCVQHASLFIHSTRFAKGSK